MDLTQLVEAVNALAAQVTELKAKVDELSNPTPPADVFTEEEKDKILELVAAESEDLKAKLEALVTPVV